MNKTDIRRIIKEEISRAITENKPKFKQQPREHTTLYLLRNVDHRGTK